MMQRWGTDAVRFMQDASEFGQHYAHLAAEVLPHIPKDGHICDAGCGLGYLSEALAEHCAQVSAIDISKAATDILKSRCTAENITVRCEDVFALNERFDAMIFCYFGKNDEILHLAKKLCRSKIIVIKRDCSEHTFSIGEVKRKHHSVEDLSQLLTDREVPFFKKYLQIELGQPFRNFDDAMRFFELYNKSDQALTPASVKSRLVSVENEEFPLYLPSVRKMELIVFSASDL